MLRPGIQRLAGIRFFERYTIEIIGGSMITRETIWGINSCEGIYHEHKIKNLNNKHIANIIHFFLINNQSIHHHDIHESLEIIAVMQDEALRRELTTDFLMGAPYPYNPTSPYVEYQPYIDALEI
jgi:hypothetical protein